MRPSTIYTSPTGSKKTSSSRDSLSKEKLSGAELSDDIHRDSMLLVAAVAVAILKLHARASTVTFYEREK